MDFPVDVWLRGTDFATTRVITGIATEPPAWTDADVSKVLKQMLLAIYQARNPRGEPDRPVFLRGFSWIVNPFEDGGVIIAIEIQAGAAVAGPFEIDKEQLEAMISRAVTLGASEGREQSGSAVH